MSIPFPPDASGSSPSLEPDVPGAVPRSGGVKGQVSGHSAHAQVMVQRKHFYEYLRTVYKRRWPAATLFCIWAIGVFVNTFTTIPVYRASTQILIDKENTNVVTFKQAIEQNQTTDDYYQTQYRILQSRALARRTIQSAGMWNHPVLNPEPVKSWTARRVVAAPMALVSKWLGRNPAPATPEAPLPNETRYQSAVIDRFLAGLTVTP